MPVFKVTKEVEVTVTFPNDGNVEDALTAVAEWQQSGQTSGQVNPRFVGRNQVEGGDRYLVEVLNSNTSVNVL